MRMWINGEEGVKGETESSVTSNNNTSPVSTVTMDFSSAAANTTSTTTNTTPTLLYNIIESMLWNKTIYSHLSMWYFGVLLAEFITWTKTNKKRKKIQDVSKRLKLSNY